jgi:hypothetical protein
MFDQAITGPEFGPGGIEVPGSRKDLTAIYYSQHNGSLVKFGKDHTAQPTAEYRQGGDWLKHRDGPGAQSEQEQILRGVHTSKFKKGFNRRQVRSMPANRKRLRERERCWELVGLIGLTRAR